MLIKGISVISAIAALAAYVFAYRLYFVPLTFIACFLILLLAWALSCVICTMFVDKDKPCKKNNPLFRFYANCIIDTVLQVLRVKLHVSGTEMLPDEKFLFVGNHRSSMDPIIEMGILRKYNTGFIANRELFEIPVIGRIMHKNFCLSLNRGQPRDEVNTVIQAINIIRSNEATIGIYPEGTRNQGSGILPLKNGAFKIAQKARCPIVVGYIRNSEQIIKNGPLKRTDVYLDIIGMLSAELAAKSSTSEIGEAVKNMFEKCINNNLNGGQE